MPKQEEGIYDSLPRIRKPVVARPLAHGVESLVKITPLFD
jgi:hypothetical protein